MQSETIKAGKCPVCGSGEVYDNSGKSSPDHRKFITVSPTKSFILDVYVCLSCGYFKEFVRDDDMKNEKLIAKTKEKWNKTGEKTNAR
jgi:predicted nucleic-acid-binding Zn-ribbon protein